MLRGWEPLSSIPDRAWDKEGKGKLAVLEKN
jgi:hypothetical protein